MSYSMLYESPVQNLELISDGEHLHTYFINITTQLLLIQLILI